MIPGHVRLWMPLIVLVRLLATPDLLSGAKSVDCTPKGSTPRPPIGRAAMLRWLDRSMVRTTQNMRLP